MPGVPAYGHTGMASSGGSTLRDQSRSYSPQGTWGRSPRAGGHGGCPPITSTYPQAEQRDSDVQPLEARG